MREESGRSMIEMIGVLAIMGAITVGAIWLISTAMKTQKRNSVNEQVIQIVSMVRNLFSEYDDYSALDGSRIFGALGMSDKNPYGGLYKVNVNPENSRQFVVSVTGLSKSDCEFFTIKAWSDSIGYQISNGKNGGATGDCNRENNENSIQIIYGE